MRSLIPLCCALAFATACSDQGPQDEDSAEAAQKASKKTALPAGKYLLQVRDAKSARFHANELFEFRAAAGPNTEITLVGDDCHGAGCTFDEVLTGRDGTDEFRGTLKRKGNRLTFYGPHDGKAGHSVFEVRGTVKTPGDRIELVPVSGWYFEINERSRTPIAFIFGGNGPCMADNAPDCGEDAHCVEQRVSGKLEAICEAEN